MYGPSGSWSSEAFSPTKPAARLGTVCAVGPLVGDTAADAVPDRGSSCLKGDSSMKLSGTHACFHQFCTGRVADECQIFAADCLLQIPHIRRECGASSTRGLTPGAMPLSFMPNAFQLNPTSRRDALSKDRLCNTTLARCYLDSQYNQYIIGPAGTTYLNLRGIRMSLGCTSGLSCWYLAISSALAEPVPIPKLQFLTWTASDGYTGRLPVGSRML